MGDPHNPERYGETWPQYKIDITLTEILPLKPFVTISGGWAWHFMCPEDHAEFKHSHDHKDVDIYVPPPNVGTVVGMLKGMGFEKVTTKYDGIKSADDFRRYEKVIEDGEHKPFRITIDFFVGDFPVRVIDGWMVIQPDILLAFYTAGHHGSSQSWCVQLARLLLANDDDPVRHPAMGRIPSPEKAKQDNFVLTYGDADHLKGQLDG